MIDEESPGFAEKLKEILKKAGEEARKQAFAAGLPIVVLKNGAIVEIYEDGTEKVIQKIRKKIRNHIEVIGWIENYGKMLRVVDPKTNDLTDIVGKEVFIDHFAELFRVEKLIPNVTGVKDNLHKDIDRDDCVAIITKNLGKTYLEKLAKNPLVVDNYKILKDDYWTGGLYNKCLEVTEKLKEAGGEPYFALHGPFKLVRDWAMSQADYGSDYMNEWEWNGKIWSQGWYHSYGPKHWRLYINTLMPKNEIHIGNDLCLAKIIVEE